MLRWLYIQLIWLHPAPFRWRFGDDKRWSITFNPIVDNSYKGGIAGLEFVPATRLDFKIDNTWTIAAEEYDDFGQLRGFMPASPVMYCSCSTRPIANISIRRTTMAAWISHASHPMSS